MFVVRLYFKGAKLIKIDKQNLFSTHANLCLWIQFFLFAFYFITFYGVSFRLQYCFNSSCLANWLHIARVDVEGRQ